MFDGIRRLAVVGDRAAEVVVSEAWYGTGKDESTLVVDVPS